jgi:hypothetical protein
MSLPERGHWIDEKWRLACELPYYHHTRFATFAAALHQLLSAAINLFPLSFTSPNSIMHAWSNRGRYRPPRGPAHAALLDFENRHVVGGLDLSFFAGD